MAPISFENSVKVAIRCDRRLCRDALASRIASEPGLVLAGHVADDADLLTLCQLSRPDVVLFDACASGVTPALNTLSGLRAQFERTKLVVIYERLLPGDVAATWPVGIDTLIPSSHGLDAVLVVLRRYTSGNGGDPSHVVAPGADLTGREREILTLVAAGHPVSRVAEILGVSARTVDNCKRRAYHKLGVANQGQAIARAAALGLLDPVPPTRPAASKPGTMLVVLRGPETKARDEAIVALLAGGISFVVEGSAPADDAVAWEHWDRGPVLQVVIEPAMDDRGLLGDGGVSTLLVRSAPMRAGEAVDLLRRGVVAILAPDQVAQALVPALLLAAAGHFTVDPAAAAALMSTVGGRPVAGDRLPQITTREEEILRSIAAGDTVRQTARGLGIAPKTVENIQARLFRKLGVRNRVGAVAVVHALGLLNPAPADGYSRAPAVNRLTGTAP